MKRFVPLLSVQPQRLRGLRLTISPCDWSETVVFEELFLNSAYDLHLVRFQPTDVIDCGGHIGMFSLLASRHYPEAVHLAGAYRELGYARGAFPIAERLAQEVLSLPIFPGITDEQLEAVGDAIEEFFRRG